MDNSIYSSYWTKSSGHTATISGGPVYNFNSTLGVELLAAYTSSRYLRGLDKNNLFAAGLGVHITL